jgi:hypothetical protein
MNNSDIDKILSNPPSIIHKVLAQYWCQNDTREYDGLAKHRQCQIELALEELKKLTPTTFDGIIVKPGDNVYILGSLYNIEEAEVQEIIPLTDYELFGIIPVQNSFSTREAANEYKLTMKQETQSGILVNTHACGTKEHPSYRCYSCCFNNTKNEEECDTAKCLASEREDGLSVYFTVIEDDEPHSEFDNWLQTCIPKEQCKEPICTETVISCQQCEKNDTCPNTQMNTYKRREMRQEIQSDILVDVHQSNNGRYDCSLCCFNNYYFEHQCQAAPCEYHTREDKLNVYFTLTEDEPIVDIEKPICTETVINRSNTCEKDIEKMDSWEELATYISKTNEYHKVILARIGALLGIEAYIDVNEDMQNTPLFAKLPQLVAKLMYDKVICESEVQTLNAKLNLANEKVEFYERTLEEDLG